MSVFCDITELSSTLDDVIEKGQKIESKQEEVLMKGLSFDPYRPHDMNEQSQFYNPYRWVDDGYMPYPVEHWRSLGKDENRESYAEVQKLYDAINFRRSAFKSFSKTVETDLAKAGVVPVGTVHTYQNGVRYKKVADGQWAPVKDPSKPMTGHDDIERHALGIQKVEEQIKAKTKEQSNLEQVKEEARREAQKQVQEAMKQMFGGELPEGLSKYFGKVTQENDMKDRESGKAPEMKLNEIQDELKPKKHTVMVEFTHNGKKYNHEFDNVLGHSKEEISGRIADLVKKRIPGAQIGRMTTTAKEKKPVGVNPKVAWKDKVKEQPSKLQ